VNRELAAELAAMVAEDQRLRRDLEPTRFSFQQQMELAQVDVRNTERLRAIVREHGWPGRSLVGERGAKDAWLLAQHASHEHSFQREVLELLRAAVDAGEAEPRHLAYLTDRVRMQEGLPQLYGTQMFGRDGGRLEPWPIEDEDALDARRAAVGLEPMADYVGRWREMSPPAQAAPTSSPKPGSSRIASKSESPRA
jgi:hypothetical protein